MTLTLASLGWDAHFADLYSRFDRPGQRPARVLRVDRGISTVFSAAGVERAGLGGAQLVRAGRDATELPCPGDWAVLRTWADRRITIEAVLPRRTRIVRAAAGRATRGQVMAANIDVAAVVEPLHPEPDLGRLERALALAFDSGARPLVLLTKADLVPDPDMLAAYVATAAPGVEVLPISGTTGLNLDPVRAITEGGGTLGLLGTSGSGKSTLVNALARAVVMPTQSIRRSDGRGRHTTTYRNLVPLPGGGAVLDTPGIRSVGVLAGEEGLDEAFADVRELAADCRYPNCQHRAEPGCAVRLAIENGELSARRLAGWQKLRTELRARMRRHAAREDARARMVSTRIIRRVRDV